MKKKMKAKDKQSGRPTVDGFSNFAQRLGINPVPAVNTISESFYSFNLVTRNRIQLEAAYRGSWMVGQIVDCVAEDMTRAGINLTSSEAADNIPELKAAMSRLQIQQSLCNGIRWGRLYGGGLGVLQIEGQKLDTELDPETVSEGQFKGIAIYDRWQLNPDLTTLIQSGPEIGLPEYYAIVLGMDQNNSQGEGTVSMGPSVKNTGQIRVHHSRVIRFIGHQLPFFQAITEMMWGESYIERLWDRLIAFDDTTLNVANLVDKAKLRMVGVDGLRKIISAGGPAFDGLVEMFSFVRRMQSNDGLTLIDKNDSYSSDNFTFTGLSDVLLMFGQQVSGASKIPLVRLFGQSPAGLSATGDSDIRMYYDNINSEQESRLRNPMEMILKVLYRSLFGVTRPKDLQFTFTSLWQMTEMDKANIAKLKAETIIAAHQQGGISTAVMMRELKDNTGDSGLFGNITDEDIEEAENELPPSSEEPPTPNEGNEAGGSTGPKPDPSGPSGLAKPDAPAVKNIS
jgi:uncharacterized protein